jgi:23S rRNA pseudouridine2604 synthase
MTVSKEIIYPVRINKYIALKGFATRREADKMVEQGFVTINGVKAQIGQKVNSGDTVSIGDSQKKHKYVAYYKPRGFVTHSAQYGEKDVAKSFKDEGLFPIGRLDKESEGLLIMTNDGRVTERLLSPEQHHTKEYVVTTAERIRAGIPGILAKGMDTHVFGKLSPANARIIADNTILIELTEGKKHQVRVMLDELHLTVKKLKRTKILNIKLGTMRPGNSREIVGDELAKFLAALEL